MRHYVGQEAWLKVLWFFMIFQRMMEMSEERFASIRAMEAAAKRVKRTEQLYRMPQIMSM